MWLVLPACLLAAYPLAIVAGANAGTLSLDTFVVGRWLFVACGAIVLAVWLLRWLQPDLPARAMWVNWVVLVTILYESAVRVVQRLGVRTTVGDPVFAGCYVAAALLFSAIVSRPWTVRFRDPIPFNFFAATLLATTLYPVVSSGITAAGDWREPVDALIASTLSSRSEARVAPTRDIYYVIVDGMGRQDVLDDIYGIDLNPFVDFLKSRGFYVADRAQSNYSQTFLSLASTLNMNYLDGIAAKRENSSDRRPLGYLIQKNVLMRAAQGAGYRVLGISSDYLATERWEGADICACERYGLDEIDQSALAHTPLAALPLDRWTYDAHRRKVTQSLRALDSAPLDGDPLFVIAHLVVPHPPFVFDADGGARQPPPGIAFSFGDGNHFGGSQREYIEGYRDQVRFVTSQLQTLIASLLRRSAVPPVIVIHGDHGPGSRLSWNSPEGTDMRERLATFAAYSFPGGGDELYPTISPVNGARVLATRYLGLHLPLVADKAYFSTWERPYDFIPVE